MKFFIPLCFLLFSVQVFGQDDHFYGTCGNEESQKIFFDGQHRYLAGRSDAIYNAPVYIVKTDTLGNVIWSKSYPDLGDVMQIISISPVKLMILFDGSSSGLLTIDTAGNVIRYSGFASGFHVYLLANYFGSVVVSGNDFNNTNANQPPFLAVLDTASNWLYGKYYIFSNTSYNYITAFAVNTDSTIFCSGGGGLNQSTFFKVDPSLSPGAFKSINIQNEEAYSVFSMPGNEYLIAGGCQTDNTLTLTKVNASNTVLWQKKYASTGPTLMAWPFSCLSSDGSKIIFSAFLLEYYTNFPITRTTYAVIETDTSGTLLFSRNYGDTAYEYFNAGLNNSAPSIITEGDHVVLQSYTTSNAAVNSFAGSQTDFQVLKLDNGFNSSIVSRNLPMTVSTNTSVPVTTNNATAIPLSMYLWSGTVNVVNQTAIVTNVSQCAGLSIPEIKGEGFVIYPNPTSGNFSIRMNNDNTELIDIKLYSSIGKLIFESNNISPQQIRVDLSNEVQGMYFVEIISGNKVYRQKLQVTR